MTKTAFVISHTHWDREWYETFQQFRIRLLKLIDRLLTILDADPAYRFFMLDGQTIVLDDYLQIRPEREADLRRHIQSGRLLIGPWYVLPDEFLVSGEAIIRNLLLGDRACARFGAKMRVGYVPDPFGHISQLPQILRGFELQSAALRRGLDDQPTELRWMSPDGSEVLLCYLRDGYDNAARLPTNDAEAFVNEARRLIESLSPFALTDSVLLMNGVDHMEPVRELPEMLDSVKELDPDLRLLHSTLPAYVQHVQEFLRQDLSSLPVVVGELRSPKRHHLLPGVLSARMWIKQRNASVQNLLSYWAEPFASWAELTAGDHAKSSEQAAVVRQAWKYLLENHPHDSICGCGVDQVHREMETRFDWAEQIGEQVTRQSLAAIAERVATAHPQGEASTAALVVFNPQARPRTDVVHAEVQLPGSLEHFVVVTADGKGAPHQSEVRQGAEFASMQFGRDEVLGLPGMVQMLGGLGLSVQEIQIERQGEAVHIDVTLMEGGATQDALVARAKERIDALLEDQQLHVFHARAHLAATATVHFVADQVPGCGYATYFLKPGGQQEGSVMPASVAGDEWLMENEFLAARVDPIDGSVRLLDKVTGAAFEGVNRFIDGGDRGDEYNYCAPEVDRLVAGPTQVPQIDWLERGAARTTLRIRQDYLLPASLSSDRSARSQDTVIVPIDTRISMSPGVRRLDVRTEVNNLARDHRLRVVFPTPIRTAWSEAEGTFDVVRRSIQLPEDTADWVEQPVETHPQSTFVDVSDGLIGLIVANRGLPEFAVLEDGEGHASIVLTLLRCVGWLSRDDMSCRKGHAGPALETPEAQCQGRHVFEYAIVPHSGNWQAGFSEAHAFNLPLRTVQTGIHGGTLPLRHSFLSLEGEGLLLSATKAAEDGDGLIVRLHNTLARPAVATVQSSPTIRSASLVDLAEKTVRGLSLEAAREGVVRLALRGKEIATLRLQM
jgi:alpha-mannosidase